MVECKDFWLPAACGGAALGANITVLLVVMSFTQSWLFKSIAVLHHHKQLVL